MALIGIQIAGPRRQTVSPGVSSRTSYLTNLEQDTSTLLPSLSLSELPLTYLPFLLTTGVYSSLPSLVL